MLSSFLRFLKPAVETFLGWQSRDLALKSLLIKYYIHDTGILSTFWRENMQLHSSFFFSPSKMANKKSFCFFITMGTGQLLFEKLDTSCMR